MGETMVSNKPFLILGGYGSTGLLIADLLLQETDRKLILAGRNQERATTHAAQLNAKHNTERVTGRRVDASDPASLKAAFADVAFVVVASSTSQYTAVVAQAAIDAGIDYLDVQVSAEKLTTLRGRAEDIKAAGCCFITDGGFHPGLPAAMVRYAAPHFDRLTSANVGSVIKLNWRAFELSPATTNEIAEELMDMNTTAYVDGTWRKLGWSDGPTFDFGPPFQEQYTVAMTLDEMATLPDEIPTLQETGFFVGGFNWFTDMIVFPVGIVLLKLSPRLTPLVGRWMGWSLKTFCKPPFGTILQLEAAGERDGQPATMRVKIAHEDGYYLTAAPVVATLLQVLDGTIGEPGLWWQANVVQPDRLMDDLQRMGVTVEVE